MSHEPKASWERAPVGVPLLAWILVVLLFGSTALAQDPQPHPVAPDPQLSESETEAEADADADADADAEADAEAEAEADADAEAEAEAEAEADAEADSEVEEDPLPEANRPRLAVEVAPREGIVTGDLFTLTIRADALKADDIAVPREQDFSPFDVLDRRARVEEGNERAVHFFELDLLALEPGEHAIPAIRIRVVTADGVVGEVETEPVTITVGSVLGNEPDAEPRPPTAPVSVYEDDYTLAWVAAALGLILLTALVTWLLTRWWRRRQKEAAPPPPPRPPWEIALEKLEALRRDRVAAVEEERVVGWVDGVSDAVREYLGHRYAFDGLESTTDEIVSELRDRKLVGISQEEVAAFLGDCDLIKFAKASFDAEQCDTLLAAGVRIVRTTMHRPEPPPPEQGIPQTQTAHPSPVVVPMPAHAPIGREPDNPDARWMPKDDPPPAAEPPNEAPASEAPASASTPLAHTHPGARPIPATLPPKEARADARDVDASDESPHDAALDHEPPKKAGVDTLPDGTRFDGVSSASAPSGHAPDKPDTMIEPAPTLPTGEPPEGGAG